MDWYGIAVLIVLLVVHWDSGKLVDNNLRWHISTAENLDSDNE